MMRLALKEMAARKLRTLLMVLAIALGVSLISGTYILTDGIDRTLGSILINAYDDVDAVISPMGGAGHAEPVSRELLDRVQGLPEVDDAAGTLIDLSGGAHPARLTDSRGNPVTTSKSFAFGIDPDEERFNPLQLVDGNWAVDGGQVVVDASTAERAGYGIGDTIYVGSDGTPAPFEIVGLARFDGADPLAGAAVALFDLETAQELHSRKGFDTILVAGKEGVATSALLEALRSQLPTGAMVRTGADQAAADAADTTRFAGFIRYFLLAFAGIALFVGAFVIVNTTSISVAQRTRQLATLRMLGASRRQVLVAVLFEGVVIGVAGSLTGLAAGFAFADALAAIFSMLDAGLPQAPTVFTARTAVVSLAVGMTVTVAAALIPARRATRVAPLAAVRASYGTSAAARSGERRTRIAVALLLAGVAVAGGGIALDSLVSHVRLVLIAVGGVIASVGIVGTAPCVTRPLTTMLTRLFKGLRAASAALGAGNTAQNPTRTAATASALMIGLGLTTFAGVMSNSIVSSAEEAIQDQIAADFIVQIQPGSSAKQDVDTALTSEEGVTEAATIRTIKGGALLEGVPVDISGVSSSIDHVYRFAWREAPIQNALTGDGAFIAEDVARSHRLQVGDPLVVETTSGGTINTTIRGIFARAALSPLMGEVVVTARDFSRSYGEMAPGLTLVEADDAAAVHAALVAFEHARVQTAAEVAQDRHRALISVVRLINVLLALTVLVSVLGMINTLVVAVLERTREIGLLRAVGMTRRQVRRMIRVEGILIALIGAALGVPLGVAAAGAVTQVAGGGSIALSIPVGTIGILLVSTVTAGLLAAALPARRASRLNVLTALQYE